MIMQYFKRTSRIEELRSCPGSRLLEEFAKELATLRYQWVAARQHIRTAEHISDIDWKEGTITVSGKGRRATALPLSQEVGQALASYIKKIPPSQMQFERIDASLIMNFLNHLETTRKNGLGSRPSSLS